MWCPFCINKLWKLQILCIWGGWRLLVSLYCRLLCKYFNESIVRCNAFQGLLISNSLNPPTCYHCPPCTNDFHPSGKHFMLVFFHFLPRLDTLDFVQSLRPGSFKVNWILLFVIKVWWQVVWRWIGYFWFCHKSLVTGSLKVPEHHPWLDWQC